MTVLSYRQTRVFWRRTATALLLAALVLATIAASHPVTTATAIAEGPPNPEARYLHTASLWSNISGHWTVLDHPFLNGNPNAIVLVTHNWNPGDSDGTYNTSPIGVWYNTSLSRWAIFNQDFSAMPQSADFNVLIPSGDSVAFVHSATADNTDSNVTLIDHPSLNANPNAKLFVTQNWNPGGGAGTYNNNPVGVYYEWSRNQWSIFNQNAVAVPLGADFNIYVPDEGEAITHIATSQNSVANHTHIDHPRTNGDPNALIYATQYWNPGMVYNPREVGVWYDSDERKWSVYNENETHLSGGEAFFILLPDPQQDAFVYQADALGGYLRHIDHPLLNGNPNAIFQVTQNYNPGNQSGVYNNHPIGISYDGFTSQWLIFNQDLASIPDYTAFNVYIPPVDAASFVHIAVGGNTSGHVSVIDHPLTNGNPDAVLFVTSNHETGGSFNPHPFGVYYIDSSDRWAIFNQDIVSVALGTAFNVTVRQPDPRTVVHTADAGTVTYNWTSVDNYLSTDNPYAMVIATSNWNPNGAGVYNNHEIGVWYGDDDRWAVFNQDEAAIPDGASFNIFVIGYKGLLPMVLR